MARTDDRSGAARVEAKRAAAAAYLAHVAARRAEVWRVGKVDGRWRVAVRRPDAGWEQLEDTLGPFDDIDPTAERYRLVGWLRDDLLDVRGIVLDRDYDAAADGREVFTIEVTR